MCICGVLAYYYHIMYSVLQHTAANTSDEITRATYISILDGWPAQ